VKLEQESIEKFIGVFKHTKNEVEAKDMSPQGKVPQEIRQEEPTKNRLSFETKLMHTRVEDLTRIFDKCSNILNKYEGLLSEQAFDEMTKILICKLSEEKRAFTQKGPNRFKLSYLEPLGALKGLGLLFEEAKQELSGIFPPLQLYQKINIQNEVTAKKIVALLEPFRLYGVGGDIQGPMYEIFLGGTLRGELGQFFTPSEIVSFMVEMINPKVGEKIIDPAVGSGGFLIQSFLTVSKKIQAFNLDSDKKRQYFRRLVHEWLWGIDINPRLATLCKINLVIHGDGYDNIKIGDSLRMFERTDFNKFDVVITNPPFNLPIEDEDILKRFDLGKGRNSQDSDVLFLELCISLLKEGGRLAIVLPEGFLNTPNYHDVREYVLSKTAIEGVISLPPGAFIPFGQSPANTCILYLKKKQTKEEKQPKVFVAQADFIGYNIGKQRYKRTEKNDLPLLLKAYKEKRGFKDEVGETKAAFIAGRDIENKRIDARYYFWKLFTKNLIKRYGSKKISDVADVLSPIISPEKFPNTLFRYIEIPDVLEQTGEIVSYKEVFGKEIKGPKIRFSPGDILFSRMYPWKGKVAMVPEIKGWEGIASSEFYVIKLKKREEPINKYLLYALLRSDVVKKQAKYLVCGTSSSRPRIKNYDLRSIRLPILSNKAAKKLASETCKALTSLWSAKQQLHDTQKTIQLI